MSTTIVRREVAPRQTEFERLVVGPAAFGAANGPEPVPARACVLYVFPEEGSAMIGSGCNPEGVADAVADAICRRRPSAVWLRDRTWFRDAWGARATGTLERSLEDLAAGAGLDFVSWTHGYLSRT